LKAGAKPGGRILAPSWAMGEGAAANFSLNERIDGLGRWLIWFRAIYSRHERYYSDDFPHRAALAM